MILVEKKDIFHLLKIYLDIMKNQMDKYQTLILNMLIWLWKLYCLNVNQVWKKATGLKLYPAYTYARIYKKGDELKRHKDRFSCEISTTMNLGGDDWPIYLSPNENVGRPDGKNITVASKAKGIKVDLKPGDMLVYSGCELEHWREKFKGKECVQVFLHYNNRKTPGAKDNMFDKRPHLGLPSWFKR